MLLFQIGQDREGGRGGGVKKYIVANTEMIYTGAHLSESTALLLKKPPNFSRKSDLKFYIYGSHNLDI